jgi:hypothetical protein
MSIPNTKIQGFEVVSIFTLSVGADVLALAAPRESMSHGGVSMQKQRVPGSHPPQFTVESDKDQPRHLRKSRQIGVRPLL